MTSSIPNGFSAADLQRMLAEARPEPESETKSESTGDLPVECDLDAMLEIAQKHVEAAMEDCKNPLVHKLMAMGIMSKMCEWHMVIAESKLDEGEKDTAAAWSRDAGKLQAMMNIFDTIIISEHDPSAEI